MYSQQKDHRREELTRQKEQLQKSISNIPTDRVLSLYEARGFNIELLDAPRAISCNGDRTPVKEMFAVRYKPFR